MSYSEPPPYPVSLAVSNVAWSNPRGAQFVPWLKEVKAIGYDGVSGFADWGWEEYLDSPRAFRQMTRDAGLELASMIVGLKVDFDFYRGVCEFMAEQDCRHLTCIGGRGKQASDFVALGSLLNALGDITNAYGIRLSYHHHTNTSGETLEDMNRLLACTAAESVYVMCDTGHATKDFIHQPLQERVTRFLEKYWDRLDFIELKDWHSETDLNTPVGEGLCNFPALFDLLRRKRYQGWIVVEQNGAEEWSRGRPPGHCAQISFDYIRRCFLDA